MSECKVSSHQPSYEELLAENERLRQRLEELEALLGENERLRRRVCELERLVSDLRAKLEASQRAAKRQAAPFSKGEPKQNPKPPGRKAGHLAVHRPRPPRIDRVVEVPLPCEQCPRCGGELTDHQVFEQFQTDLPPVEPITTQFNVHVARCGCCGERVQGRHPEQSSDALGSAGVQIGANALALACEMKHRLGVSYGKVREFFRAGFGMLISRGTFATADLRLAKLLEASYVEMVLCLREKPAVYVDETGWKVGGQNAWLWVFTQEEITVYVIEASRGHEVVEKVLGAEFRGVMVCDCFLAYEPLGYEQQKCLGHLLNRCSQIAESKSGRAVLFSRKVACLLRAAIKLREKKEKMKEHGYKVALGKLEAKLERLLDCNLKDPDNVRLCQLLLKHRHRLFRFLYEEGVEATNNRAERGLRPAVIARKLSAGNKSQKGAYAHAVLASVIQSCRQQGQDFLALARKVLCNKEPMVLPIALPAQPRAP